MNSSEQRFYYSSELLHVVNGNTNAAVLLSICKARQELENLGQKSGSNIYWSKEGVSSATGLNRWGLDSARRLLRETGILTEKVSWQSKLDFHIDLGLLDQQITSSIPDPAERAGRVEIPMSREILHFTGKNIYAALMLSYAMIRQKEANEAQSPEKFGIYWPMQQKEWYRLFGLTRRKQESAREVLLKTGCWKERQWGWPAQNEFHLDLEQLMTIEPRLANEPTGV